MKRTRTGSRSSRGRWIALALVVALGAAGYWAWSEREAGRSAPVYRTAQVARGPISASVSASGTLNPVVAVPVGSQVSGQVKEVLVDFNDEVRKGQLVARIDPETFEYRVRQSQADVEAARAQVLTAQANVSAARAAVSRAQSVLAEAERDLGRKQALVERGFISPAELDRAKAAVTSTTEDLRGARAQIEVAQAQTRSAESVVKQREAQLAQARVDLERTAIRAPVDGIVIKKSIERGQTVAASLQAPELFVIARSLREMQVETSVDEAEIGKVKAGQRATFTVDSFPGRNFAGEVLQVRKAAQTVQNVVTYTVVVSAANTDLALVPGMTANVRIVTEQRENVLKVPNAALRFRPPDFQEPQPGRAAREGAIGALAGGVSRLVAAAHAQGQPPAQGQGGGALAQFRARLERDLSLTDAQKQQVDAIFAAMREKFAAIREAPEGERAALRERNRAELRERIAEILNPGQRARYLEIVAEISGRQPSRGRVFVLDETGKPRPVQVRTGLSDGSFTEVSGEGIKEGDTVVIGLVSATGASAPPPRQSAPRLPF